MAQKERRESQRLKLAKPILALFDGESALILDIGVAGAYVEHHGVASSGETRRLAFRWHGAEVEFVCEVIRSAVVRDGGSKNPVSHTGVRFVEAIGDAEARLQEMMATFVGRVLAAQRANASGSAGGSEGETILARIGDARRLRSSGFVSYRLRDGKWWRVPTDKPEQPDNGFTVAAYEDEGELETLCAAYEAADEEGRRMIRLVAELSVRSAKKP
jgi:hypothetical protein